jgi:peptidyl-tRNA hydrolase
VDTESIIENETPASISTIIPDELRAYFVINTDLKMSIGKTAVQLGHAVQYLLDKRDEVLRACDHLYGLDIEKKLLDQAFRFNEWKNGASHCKIALAANTDQFRLIKELYADSCVVVRDAGRTEITPGSETVIGLYPMRKSERSKLLEGLRLL